MANGKLKSFKVPEDLGEAWKEGQVLKRAEHIAAYFRDFYQDNSGSETELAADEILRLYNKVVVEANGEEDYEDIALSVNEAIGAYVGGKETAEEEQVETKISPVSAAHRQALAATDGAKLDNTFSDHLASILAANLTLKKGPVVIMDDLRRIYDEDKRLSWPFPGSKAPKNYEGNEVFDIYKTEISGETVRSSWFKDQILAVTSASDLDERIKAVKALPKQELNADNKATQKTAEEQLNLAVNALRKGAILDRVLLKLDTYKDQPGTLRYEVQREKPGKGEKIGAPAATKYPVHLWQDGQSGKTMKGITLSQLLHLFDVSDPTAKNKISRIDAVKANGGTMEAFNKYGLPKKKGRKKGTISVENVDQAFEHLFAVANYLTVASAGQIVQKLDAAGEVGEAYISHFGDVMSKLVPLWNGDRMARYEALSAKPKKKKDAA